MVPPPEPWLRGPIPGLIPALQPVGHALVAALEEVRRTTEALASSQLWIRPSGAASIGFHLLHLSGSTDRLFTYARGAALSEEQRSALAAERELPVPPPTLAELLRTWQRTVDASMGQLAGTTDAMLGESRTVGRDRLPSTVRGLLFHAAEHAQRHTGQIVTTVRIVRLEVVACER